MPRRRQPAIAGALMAALLLAACTVGPDFHSPTPAAEHGFGDRTLGRAAPGETQQTSTLGAEARADWWALLGSAKLDAVIREALAQNWDLASREAALDRARRELSGV